MPNNIIAFGEILWDMLPGGATLGGAPLNLACRAQALGHDAQIASRLGRDERGLQATERIAELGVDTSLIQWDDDHPTGVARVDVDEQGAPSFKIERDVAYDYIDLESELLNVLKNEADCLCFGTLAQRAKVSRNTLRSILDQAPDRVIRVLDVNLRKDCYIPEIVAASLEAANALKLSHEETEILSEMFDLGVSKPADFPDAVLDRWGLGECIVTFGSLGAIGASSDGERSYAPGYRVEVTDTCGSGDAFTAAWLHRRLGGATLAESIDYGCALGALVATHPGATRSVSPKEIETFLASQPPRESDEELMEYDN